ncbi:formylglycine-generating enzyme family protein [Allocoleopsis sp.]|uniref:formylglycine-generating enzyme family protein n=1 Tax=Allocoleopsis sp. TaxID=3088169 RepID=UPI002FD4C29E
MSQSEASAKSPSGEADNHPPQPRTDDAVLGGTAPSPVGCVVLGGLEGVKRRLAAAASEQRVAALKEALQYGEAGLELVMLGLEDDSRQVRYAAFSLLAAQDSPRVKQRLRNYLPWFEFEVVTVDAWGRESNRYRNQAQYFSEDVGNGVFLDIVSIPGGTFLMGSPDTEKGRNSRESPQHSVTVKPFYLGKFPVTQKQWKAVAALPQVMRHLDFDPSDFKGDNLPVEQVSWDEAVEFCQRLSKKTGRSYRLPSEAEWEYACRAGTTTPFQFGETITSDLANYNGNFIYGSEPKGIFQQETTPVGSFQVANAFGLYDMHGNVWEWCADYCLENYKGAPSDERAWSENHQYYHVLSLRGGSWFNTPGGCRSAYRVSFDTGKRRKRNNIGFRVGCVAAKTL